MGTRLFAFTVLFGLQVWAQQLNGTYMNIDYPGLSKACIKALNTSVACPLFLAKRSMSNGILDSDAVNALCVDGCRTSLKKARTSIVAACNASTDTITFGAGKQKASYIVDNYLHAFDVSCRKDASTGKFCDPYLLEWSQQGFMAANETCSDCWLGGQALQLNNPLGYDEALASNFASLASSCSAGGKYSFTLPPSSTTSGPTVTTTKTPTASCTPSYTLQPSDVDCHSVAKALKVSSYDLIVANGLDLYCQNFDAAVAAKTKLCVPAQCQTYTWQSGDSCESVLLKRPSINMAQFLAWNPGFNALCRNTVKFSGYEVCVSPPGGYDSPNNTAIPGGPTITSPVPAPTNGAPESSKRCGKWYTVVSGDSCGAIALANSLSLADFYFLNPALNVNCTNLELKVAYCVAPVGDINTYPGHPKPTHSGPWSTISIPPVTFPPVNTGITTQTGDPGYVATGTALLPKASGTVQGCSVYRNYDANSTELNACGYLAYAYDVSVEQLRQWNPSLGTDCVLQAGLSYCVESAASGSPTPSPTPDYCFPINATEPGTVAGCSCFTQVRGYQNSSGYTCASIADSVPISLSQLLAWNSWLGTSSKVDDCTKALYAKLDKYGRRAVCIGAGTSSGLETTLTSTPTKTPTPVPSSQ